MTESCKKPARIVMATDLSARCDRALDRAALLARQWGADLIAVNVLDPTDSPQQTLAWVDRLSDDGLRALAHKQMLRDMAMVDVKVSVRIVEGKNVAQQICTVVDRSKAGVLVIAVAHSETFGRFLLGSTVDQLAQQVTVPLLVVRQRPHGVYKKIVVGTDLSESSRKALITTAHLFPDQELILYHAEGSTVANVAGKHVDQEQTVPERTVQACEEFLKSTPLPNPDRVRLVLQGAYVKRSLPGMVIDNDVDLVVLGNKSVRGLRRFLQRNNSTELLQWLPCDVLLVP